MLENELRASGRGARIEPTTLRDSLATRVVEVKVRHWNCDVDRGERTTLLEMNGRILDAMSRGEQVGRSCNGHRGLH